MQNKKLAALTLSLLGLISLAPSARALELKEDEHKTIEEAQGKTSDVSADRWYNRFEINGEVAGSYMRGGADRVNIKSGTFAINEAILEMTAKATDHIYGFVELYPIFYFPSYNSLLTGEAYVGFKNLVMYKGESLLNIKAGRVDLPYGEEYLTQDARANPLISRSAAWIWGFDEGVKVYGQAKFGVATLGYLGAVTNGGSNPSAATNNAKSWNAKLHATLFDSLYLSGSFMTTDDEPVLELWQGLRHLQPDSTAFPISTNAKAYELDAKYTLGQRAYLSFMYGQLYLEDVNGPSNRASRTSHTLHYLSVEPLVNITEQFYAVARYSMFGTVQEGRGIAVNDGFTAVNSRTVSDVHNFQRMAIGVGYKPVSTVAVKLEVGNDWYTAKTNATSFVGAGDLRFIGLQTVMAF